MTETKDTPTHGVAGNMACKCKPSKQFATVTTLVNHLLKNGVSREEIYGGKR